MAVLDLLVYTSGFLDPVAIFIVLFFIFSQLCSREMRKRSLFLQLALMIFYMATVVGVTAYFVLDPRNGLPKNITIAALTVFFFCISFVLLFVGKGRARDYGLTRAGYIYFLMMVGAGYMLWLFLHYGASLPDILSSFLPAVPVSIPPALIILCVFLLAALALVVMGLIYDMLLYRETDIRLLCMSGISCVSNVLAYYIYVTEAMTRPFFI